MSGITDISDAIFLFSMMFAAGKHPTCMESADANNDGVVDLSDGIVLLAFLFMNGEDPAFPGPANFSCGVDPDEPGSSNDLGCDRSSSCSSSQ